jgi:glucose-1-phosphate thymidylyltransferase
MAIVGVLPAAGYATRLQPLDRSKEVLEVAGRPVIDYLVERMRVGGCTELRIVTRPEKEDVVAYAEGVGASLIFEHPETINESFAAGMVGLDRDDIALIGYPDSVWEPVDGFRPLVEAVKEGQDLALGLFDAPGLESDYVRLDGSGRIEGIEIKPEQPPSSWIWGVAAARAHALQGIENVEWPSEHMNARLGRGLEPAAIRLSDRYLDIGTRAALARAEAWAS